MVIKLGRVMTYSEFPIDKSHECLITWSCEVTRGGVTRYAYTYCTQKPYDPHIWDDDYIVQAF